MIHRRPGRASNRRGPAGYPGEGRAGRAALLRNPRFGLILSAELDGGCPAHVITSAMSTAISADRDRVWRALTTPSELIRWDEQIIALLDPAPDFPNPGQSVRWRYRIGSIEIDAQQTIREIQPHERLHSEVSLGLFQFDETYTLASETEEPDRTRLRLSVVSSNAVPVVGGMMDRFTVRRLSAKLVDSRMRSVQKWCESSD